MIITIIIIIIIIIVIIKRASNQGIHTCEFVTVPSPTSTPCSKLPVYVYPLQRRSKYWRVRSSVKSDSRIKEGGDACSEACRCRAPKE